MSRYRFALAAGCLTVLLAFCHKPLPGLKTRQEAIPADAVKMTPAMDTFPPILRDTEDFELPVPMPGPVNTAGCEDSPFILPDGSSFYFFFTPDIRVPVEKQLVDSATGIYWAKRSGTGWTEPERVLLNDDVALDGAEFVQGDTMWFASVRAGNLGEIDVYKAVLKNGVWGDVRNAGRQLNKDLDIGEFHLSADGKILYFHWNHTGGYGDLDIWKVERSGDTWGSPENMGPNINSPGMDGWPFVSESGKEFWLTRSGPSVWRSVMTDSGWSPAQEIVSQLAGEPTLDRQGNLYFVHHYMATCSRIIEADIYVARRKIRLSR